MFIIIHIWTYTVCMMPMHEPNHLKPVLPLNFPTYDSKKNRTMTHITSFFLLTNSHEQYKSQFEFKMRAVARCVFLVFPWIFRLKQTKSDENWTSTTDNLMFVRAPVAHTVFLWWNCFLYICFFLSLRKFFIYNSMELLVYLELLKGIKSTAQIVSYAKHFNANT